MHVQLVVRRSGIVSREVTNLLFNYIEGFNEGIIAREAEMRASMVKCGERLLEVAGEGEGVCEIPMRLPMNDGAMETVEYIWVDIWCMLDWIIGYVARLQKYISLS